MVMNKIFTLILLTAIFLINSCQNKMDKAYGERKNKLEYRRGKVYEYKKDTNDATPLLDTMINCCYRSDSDEYRKTSLFIHRKLQVLSNDSGIRSLRDSAEEEIQLRGMSTHGLQWGGMADITEENIKTLATDWKCNLFRIVIHVDEEGGYFCNPGRTHRLLDSTVIWCEKAGIYCLIDFYVSRPGNPNDSIYRNHYIDTAFLEKGFGGYINIASGKKHIDLAKTFFTYCAKRYKYKKNIIYGLCAQPSGVDFNNVDWEEYDNPKVTWQNHIRPYCEEMIGLIRYHDPTVVIVCGTPHLSTRPQDVINNEPKDSTGKKYKNLMYALQICANSYIVDNPNFKNLFKDTVTAISPIWKKVPIFVTTFMTTDGSGWLNINKDKSDKWLELFNKYNLSWCNWSFTSEEEGGLCCALTWHCGRIPEKEEDLDSILTESGIFIRNMLRFCDVRDSIFRRNNSTILYKDWVPFKVDEYFKRNMNRRNDEDYKRELKKITSQQN